ncbi:4'-phosphopantetheinyl transferase superfamily protein [Bifidobacterium sp. ESL0763]|uniref:holo-ACP synthase n=1 Tax=Bifidobacterium sp. ESL0763 TaxID=2983227 RepID=UPI0023F93BED|nr:4'-phosphopantetheinyl transferase superfamily protein [Bifidobacterium sp. ESL0763]MDF7663373.1 4'-phosphopantetheinyl transferase superfamily protein [Bifidobacterium sp. ESL0763]
MKTGKIEGSDRTAESLLGLGHDVVDVAGFAAQLGEPGSRMRGLFSARELRQAALRAKAKHDDEATHLAARWAGKEAVLKAWCEALGERPNPYTLDDFPWTSIEILDDSRSRPHVVLGPACEATLRDSLGLGGGADSGGDAQTDAGNGNGNGNGYGKTNSGDDVDGDALRWHISLSHDGPVASAVVALVALAR